MEPKKRKEVPNGNDQPIKFYLPKDDYGFLSNFYPSEFNIEGRVYKTN